MVQLQGADGGNVSTWLVLGELVAVHVAQALLKEGIHVAAAARNILRGGGSADYLSVGGWEK